MKKRTPPREIIARLRSYALMSAFLTPHLGRRPQITDGNRTFKTQDDPERLAAAEAKRAQRAARRAGK